MIMVDKWPNLFIVGTPKAGTSSLYVNLSNIPGIFMSSIKEPNYFSSKTIPKNSRFKPIRDKSKYLALFKKAKNEKYFGEASSSYLSDYEAPNLIHNVSPDARIIISLRDPIERAFSYYLMYYRNGLMKGTFHEELKKSLKLVGIYNIRSLELGGGLYSEDVQRYLDIFGTKQVKILIFEKFIVNPKKNIEEILSFLDIKYDLQNFTPEVFNKFGIVRGPIAQFLLKNSNVKRIAEKIIPPTSRRIFKEKILLKSGDKPQISKIDKDILIEFYRKDVLKLQSILGEKLPWSNFQ